jgi:hypothetical protein
MSRERKESLIKGLKITAIIVLVILIIGIPAFAYFRVSTKAHMALREAKNVKIAITMLDIEYYAQGASIYAPTRADGLKKGAVADIWETVGFEGDVVLRAYDKSTRTVEALTYTNDHFEVNYYIDDDGEDRWTVRYFFTVIN